VHQIWLTAIGRDRPGVVARIANVLLQHRLNIEDSQMRILGGRFAMMMLLRGEAHEDQLYRDLLAVGRELGLDYVYVHPMAEMEVDPPVPTHRASLFGGDRPGQVAAVSEALAALGVSITNLATRIEGQSSVLELEVVVPGGVDIRSELERVAREREIDVTVAEL
jgi:glycine cleavage system transcriptional repressor